MGSIRRVIIFSLYSIALLCVLIFPTKYGEAFVDAVLFIPQVIPSIPVKPLELVTDVPEKRLIQFPTETGVASADLYIPSEPGKHSGILFFMGVVPPDSNEERIVALGEGLARSGLVVMIPWLETQHTNQLVVQDIDDLVWAFEYLRSMEIVNPNNVGMGGICTGASMVMVAAQDSRISSNVKYINSFAGYYDALDMVRSISSRSRFYGDQTSSWIPDKLTLELFTSHLIQGVYSQNEKDLLTRIHINNEIVHESEILSLSDEAINIHLLLKGQSLEVVDQILLNLSVDTIDELRKISPSTNIDQLSAKVFVMHDVADKLVPSEESKRLADFLVQKGQVYHTEFNLFQNEIQVHKDDNNNLGFLNRLMELTKLFLHMYNIMLEVNE